MKTRFLTVFVTLCISVAYASNSRYRVMFREDPATSMVIGWDQTGGSNPVVYYDIVDHGTNVGAYSYSQSVSRSVSYKGMNNNFARLSGLQPNTAYYFVIQDSDGTSQRFWFKTCPDNSNERLSFIAGGDSRNNATPRRNANKLVAKLKPHAVFFGGDMTNGDSNSEWLEWMNDWQLTIGSDGRMIPIVAARGNHEDSNNSIYHLFDVPSTNVYYAITFGGNLIRSYTLNTEISISGNQTTWLNNDLEANQNVYWKTAQYHKPMRPHVSSKSEGNTQYSSWATPFKNNNVKLVIECDAHTVKTTWPVVPSTGSGNDEGFVRDDINGTVYAGEGCWGAPLRSNNDSKNWTRASGQFNQFKWIFVDKDKIELRTVRVDNADQVGSVNDNDIFTAPSNLDIWNPSTGSVVTIQGAGGNLSPTVDITSPSNRAYYNSVQNINVSVNANDSDGNVDRVEFYIDDVLKATDNSAPYSATITLNSGTQLVKVKAVDNEGASNTDQISVSAGAYSQTVEKRINSSNDDVEENANGSMYTNSSDLELVADGSRGNQIIGLRFTDLGIPQGATIDEAYIQFTCDETNTGTTSVRIKAHDTDNASAFQTSNNNVSNRSRTTASSLWTPNAWSSVGASTPNERTPELKSILQEIVDRNGWNAGNAMVFIIEGTGERTAEAYDGTSSGAPLLHVSFTVGEQEVPNQEPSVSITSPANGTQYDEGNQVVITANANDADGSISTVDFYANGTLIGSDNSSPYSISYTIGVGNVALTAVAIDNEGASSTSEVITIQGNSDDTGDGSKTLIDFNNFEQGWGIWNDGGSDARRSVDDAPYSNGSYSIRLRDNTSTSVMTTDNLSLQSYDQLVVSFSYYAASMDNSNEDFWLQISNDGGASFTTVEEWNRNDEFQNNQRYNDEVIVQGPFTSNTKLRFRCDASGNSDWVYIDDVRVEGVNGGGTPPANAIPSVSIISPSNGALYPSGSSVSINIDANDADGTVASVEIYSNGVLVGTDVSSPYSQVVTLNEGSNSISVIAVDNEGASSLAYSINIVGEEVVTPPETVTFERRVSSANDDAEEGESGAMYLNSSDLELVYDTYNSQGNQEVGIRFTNVAIPQGATITNAYITFTVDEATTGACDLLISAQDADNAAIFTTADNDISNRSKTVASVNWVPQDWNTVGQNVNTPDLKDLIQEVTDRGGWNSGNSMAFVITGSGKRTAESYNGSSSSAPMLHVTYEASGDNMRIGTASSVSFVNAYPNPVSDVLHISNDETGEALIKVQSLQGDLLLDTSLEKGAELSLDVSLFVPGTYLITIQKNNEILVKKVIVE